MSTQNNKWKDYFLKSGLPLEFDVKKTLDSFGFDCYYEYSYLRPNENNVSLEFSYDLDSTFKYYNHFFELLIECKFRDESTNWIFIPDDFNETMRGSGSFSFIHTNDYFYNGKYDAIHNLINYPIIAPLCSKGIEINSSGSNPKSITQAISQLSFGMINKLINSFNYQLDESNSSQNNIFHHIPIIFTTANLFRLKKDVTISEIKNSNDIDNVATKESILLLEPKINKELENYNHQKLNDFIKEFDIQKLDTKLNRKIKKEKISFIDYKKEIAERIPEGILIIQHEPENTGIKIVVDVLKEIARPSKMRKEIYKIVTDKIEKYKREFNN